MHGKAFADQHQGDMGHVAEIADRAERGHFGNAVMRQQSQHLLDQRRPHAGMAMGVIVDGGRDDRPRPRLAQRLADAHRVAHHDIARQLPLFRPVDDDIGEPADTGVHAIGEDVLFDDGIDDGAAMRKTPPGGIGEGERRAIGNGGGLLPGEWAVEGNGHGDT